MLPLRQLSSKDVIGPYITPANRNKNDLEWYELGGIALQDPSQGLQYQTWKVYYEGSDFSVRLIALTTQVEHVLFIEPNVAEVSFAFDQNMRWSCVYKLVNGVVKFKWYDSAVEAYVTTEYPATYLSPKLTLDDKRSPELFTNDILLTYVRDRKLYVRTQRDRYLVEDLMYSDLPAGSRIINFGMNNRLRIQWRFKIIPGG